MNFVKHPACNHVIGAPRDWDQRALSCDALPVNVLPLPEQNCLQLTSYWKPTPDELIELNSGGYVTLGVLGRSHPVVTLGVVPRTTAEVHHAPAADTPRRRAGD